MTDVLVTGASGKMGSLSARTIAAQADLRLAALVDPRRPEPIGDAPCFTGVEQALALTSPQAALEFSVPAAVFDNARMLLEAGVPTVVGTTGLLDEQVGVLSDAADEAGVGLILVPNFALGAVLLIKFAQLAAPHYESVEIIELHHPDKVDAPSGTARHTAEMVAAARREAGLGPVPDATSTALEGARGAQIDGVRVHSVRLRGLVAHEEVLLGAPGEQLTLRHDSFDRSSFIPGVLLGVRTVSSRPGLTVGLEHFLDL